MYVFKLTCGALSTVTVSVVTIIGFNHFILLKSKVLIKRTACPGFVLGKLVFLRFGSGLRPAYF